MEGKSRGAGPSPERDAARTYSGARRPDRRRDVNASGLRLAVYEWGDAEAPPLLLAHGGFDFAGTFDVFAPLLAEGGWRVVSWDQRGHGDSEHAALYSWDADMRDALGVLDTVSRDPVPLVGHSKGGGILTQLAEALPHRAAAVVSIDGLPSRRRAPDVADHERTRLLAEELGGWLDHRRRIAALERKTGTLEELARRRQRMNPRLPLEWLLYIATIGARRDPDGWRWKIDPALRFGGFGPWRPDWSLERLPGLSAPLLGVLGTEEEPMGWGATIDSVRPYLPCGARIVAVEKAGHFVHIERPKEVADLVLEFLS
jgi:pimeloyl-ACP methyl ester carboxylesterase